MSDIGYTLITASNIRDIEGRPFSGRVEFTGPVNGGGKPLTALVNGSLVVPSTRTFLIADGTITGDNASPQQPAQVADTALTNPVNIGYTVEFFDRRGKLDLPGFVCVQPSGAEWALDEFIPDQRPLVALTLGEQGPPLTPRGNYDSGTTYAEGDLVFLSGSSYVSVQPSNIGNAPTSSASWWQLLAAQGAAGADGVDGSLDASGVGSLGAYVTANQPAGRNLLDPRACTVGFGVHPQDGSLLSLSGATASGFIPCAGAGHIYLTVPSNSGWNSDYGHAFYDSARAYITGDSVAVAGAVSVPSGAAYFRQSVPSPILQTAQVVLGSVAPTSYAAFGYDSPDAVDSKIAAAVEALPESASLQLVRDMIGETQPPIPNLFDVNRAIADHALHPADGTVNAFSGLYASDFIRVYPGETYTTNVACNYLNPDYGFAYYDEDKVYVSGDRQAAGTYTVPAGVHFYRQYVRVIDLNFAMIVRGSTLPSPAIGFGADDPFTAATKTAAAITAAATSSKVFGVFGDSISAVFAPFWQTTLATKERITHGFNDARAGRATADALENFGNGTTGYSGTPFGGVGANNWQLGMAAGQTLAQALAPVDVLFVWLGTNDGGYVTGGTVGSPGDASARTGSTFCAAVAWLIETLQTAKPLLRIIWITPYHYDPTNGHGGSNTTAGNQALVDAIVGTCALYGVPVVDLFRNSGINAKNWSAALRDGLHPSEDGFNTLIIPAINRVLAGYR